MTGATERVGAALPDGARAVLTEELSPTDLQTLLLDVARVRAGRADPARLLRRWGEDRFVAPAAAAPPARTSTWRPTTAFCGPSGSAPG